MRVWARAAAGVPTQASWGLRSSYSQAPGEFTHPPQAMGPTTSWPFLLSLSLMFSTAVRSEKRPRVPWMTISPLEAQTDPE